MIIKNHKYSSVPSSKLNSLYSKTFSIKYFFLKEFILANYALIKTLKFMEGAYKLHTTILKFNEYYSSQ